MDNYQWNTPMPLPDEVLNTPTEYHANPLTDFQLDGASPGTDRVTDILRQKAATLPQKQEYSMTQQPGGMSMQPWYQGQSTQSTPMEKLGQKIQEGDPQATMLLKRTQMFTNGDPASTEDALQFLIDHPNDIDPSNSYQVNTALAQWAKQSGVNPALNRQAQNQAPTRLTQEQLSMQDLGNIASKRGTDFFGLQQADEKHIADLEASQALSAKRISGGSTPAAIQVANEIEAAEAALEQALATGDVAGAQKAQQRKLNLQQSQKILKMSEDTYMTSDGVQRPNEGALNTRESLKYADKSGDQKAVLGYARAIEKEKALGSPMPESAMNYALEAESLASQTGSTNADVQAIIDGIGGGDIKLGPAENAASMAKNWAGMSNPNSRNFASLKGTLEGMRNVILLYAKGVQTEGDALRAYDQMMSNLNDGANVAQRLKEILAQNERNAKIQIKKSNAMRENYGREATGFEDIYKQPPAVTIEKSGESPIDAEMRKRGLIK